MWWSFLMWRMWPIARKPGLSNVMLLTFWLCTSLCNTFCRWCMWPTMSWLNNAHALWLGPQFWIIWSAYLFWNTHRLPNFWLWWNQLWQPQLQQVLRMKWSQSTTGLCTMQIAWPNLASYHHVGPWKESIKHHGNMEEHIATSPHMRKDWWLL